MGFGRSIWANLAYPDESYFAIEELTYQAMAQKDTELKSTQQPIPTDASTQYVITVLTQPRQREFPQINELDLFYEQLLTHAIQWGDDEIALALTAIDGLHGDIRKFSKVATLLQTMFRRQQKSLGGSHAALARTEMLLGICQQKMRMPESAVTTLRSAVTRFQQCDDGVDRDVFVDCLCALASSYRDTGNYEASRTCIKQAYRLLPAEDAPLRLQCAALEELAADLLGEHRFKSALEAYERVAAMKAELLKTEATDVVRPLIQLGMCHFALHQLDGAEKCLIKAGQMYHELRYNDRDLLVQVLDALGGTLRHKAQFMQADILEEAGLELKGRSEQMGGHMLYGNLVRDAVADEQRGDHQSAKSKYREALCSLESQRQKRAVDRLHILAKIMLLTAKNQLVQRSSLHSDIEDSVRSIFCGVPVTTSDGIRRISLIYDLCGKKESAASLKQLAMELDEQIASVKQNHVRVADVGPEQNSAARISSVVPALPLELPRVEARLYEADDADDVEEV